MKNFTIECSHGPTDGGGSYFSAVRVEAKTFSQAAKKLYISWNNPFKWYRIASIREIGPGVIGKIFIPKRWKTKNCRRR